MRCLQIGMDGFPARAGGLSRYHHELCRSLQAAGVEVRGLVVGSDDVTDASGGAILAYAEAGQPLIRRLRAGRAAITGAIKAFRPDVVAAHFALYALPALDALGRQPLVVHFHGPWAAEARAEGAGALAVRIKHRLESAVYRRAGRVIVLSHAYQRLLAEDYRIPASRIDVIPGGVDTGRFRSDRPQGTRRADARGALGWPTDRPIVVTVRRLVPRMGLAGLVAAIDRLRASVPDVLLMIAGRGPLAAELGALIAARGLQQQVRLIGHVPDASLPLVYQAADLSVVPSLALEGFGLVAAESLAAGTPAMVTPVGGLPEVVADLSPALVFEAATDAAIADGLARGLRGGLPLPDPIACQAFARSRFDWQVVTPRIVAVYAGAG